MPAKIFLKSTLVISLFFGVFAVSETAHAKIIYVDDNAPGNNKGFSWTNAYNDLRDAITDARSSPKPVEIRVAQGTYKPKEGVFVLINGITLKGGYAGFEESDPEDRDINLYKTILSGDCNGDDVEVIDPMDLWSEPTRADNVCVVHSTNCNETAVLDGFIITAGRSLSGGGGMYNYNSSPTIINCTFSANTAGDDGLEGGGAIYSYYGNPVLINCEFIGNSAGDSCGGGGMYNDYSNPTLINCTFIANTAEYYGGGMINFWSNPVLMDCTFIDNFSPDRGGGIHNDYGSFRPTLTDCAFLRNRSGVDGGAIYNFSGCSPKIANCTFKNNSAGKNGGAVANFYGNSPKFLNCLFTANSAEQNGGGMYNHGYSPAAATKITGCTFVTNSATNGSAVACDSYEKKYPIHLLITNCIFWDGGNEIWNNDNSTISITYSNIQGAWTGQGNIDTDPCFVDDVNEDYHLLPTSPCIDAGDPNYVAGPNETDLDDKPRVIAGRIDMGAYEFQSYLILYVDADATGANDGSSWADAFNYLQDALATAYYGDEIRVAQGTYKPDQGAGITPGDREATFQLSNGVTIKGGYAGFGQTDPNARHLEIYETILTGDLNGDDADADDIYQLHRDPNREENSYHVLSGSGTNQTAVLDGFVVTGGNADGIYTGDFLGAGLANYSSGSPTIVACIFKENLAYHGGGIHNGDSSNPKLIGCKFIANESRGHGAGVYNEISSPIISRCTFTANKADGGSGAGVGNFAGSSPSLTDCIFFGNFATGSGGGIFNTNSSNPNLTNCEFTGNSTKYDGGGMYNYDSSPNLINCTFSGNSAGDYGYCGGVYNEGGGNPMLTNCILWGNRDKEGVDESAQIYGGQPFVSYTCIQGLDMLAGNGNIGTDPCFVELGYWQDPRNTPYYPWDDVWVKGDYHLLSASMCIDAGDPNYIAGPGETDLNGRPRVMGDRIDMGAYEMPILAEARIVPQTINLASKGNRMTCYIWLPAEYDATDIEPNSIFLEGQIQPEQFSVDEQQQLVTTRFARDDVHPVLELGDINLKITGRLTDGTVFEAKDTIKVIDKAVKN